MAHVCTCGKEFTNKKDLRKCIFSHLDEEKVEVKETPIEQEEEIEVVPDDEPEEVINDLEDFPELEELKDPGYFMQKPIVVQVQKVNEQVRVYTPNGEVIAAPGDYVVVGASGETQVYSPEVFEMMFEPCDGEFPPVVIPRRLCPEEIQWLATGQIMSLKVTGLLTEDFEIIVKETSFERR